MKLTGWLESQVDLFDGIGNVEALVGDSGENWRRGDGLSPLPSVISGDSSGKSPK